jgi:general secretion pathway protein G
VRRWVKPGHPGRRPASVQQGFSLLELVIVVILVALLFLFAFDRLMPLRGQAEGTQVASTIGALRSALGMEVAERIVDRGHEAIVELEGSNPMTLLQQRPQRYLGVRTESDKDDIPGGAWYFDPNEQALRYRVRFPQYLDGEPDPPVDLGWQVQLQYDDKGQTGSYDPETDSLRGVTLAPLDDHHWPNLPRRFGQSVSDDIRNTQRPVDTGPGRSGNG